MLTVNSHFSLHWYVRPRVFTLYWSNTKAHGGIHKAAGLFRTAEQFQLSAFKASLKSDNSSQDGSFKGLSYRHTCHTLSRPQSGNSSAPCPCINPYHFQLLSAEDGGCDSSGPTIMTRSYSRLTHTSVSVHGRQTLALLTTDTSFYSQDDNMPHPQRRHISHTAHSYPAGAKIESLTDTTFSASLGK